MLGISYLELLFVLGLGSVILGTVRNNWNQLLTSALFSVTRSEGHHCGVYVGPKDLPRVARHVGQATGRAAAFLTLARSKFARFSEDAKLDKVV